jgi:hypothetical protein
MAQTVSPATVALARRRYQDGATVKSILAETKLTRRALERCVAGDFDDGTGATLAPLPPRQARAAEVGREALVARLWRNAERQVEQIEQRLAAAGHAPAEGDANARALATLVKTLRELSAFDEEQARRQAPAEQDDDDDPIPRDIDEFRRELARRMDAFVDERMGNRIPRD